MSILEITRQDFYNRYNKPATKSQARKALKAWDAFLQARGINEADLFLSIRPEERKLERYRILDQLVQHWKELMYPTSVRNYFNFVKAWFNYNDIELSNSRIKDKVMFPKPVKERVRGIDRDIIQKILDHCNPYYKALVLVLVSTGMRDRSEALNMTWDWINFQSSPPKITIPAAFSKNGQERITFLTPEAARMLVEMRRGAGDDQKVFPKSYAAMYQYISRIRTKLGLNGRGQNGMFHFKPHRFRGFTENKLSKAVGEEFAHAMIGHGSYLGQYFSGGTTDEEAARDYEAAIPYLTISKESALLDENEKLKEREKRYVEMEQRYQEMEDRVKRLERKSR